MREMSDEMFIVVAFMAFAIVTMVAVLIMGLVAMHWDEQDRVEELERLHHANDNAGNLR